MPIGISDIVSLVNDGDLVEYSFSDRTVRLKDGKIISFSGLQGPLLEIFEAGGLVNFVKKQMAKQV
jgi:hypothetical protein